MRKLPNNFLFGGKDCTLVMFLFAKRGGKSSILSCFLFFLFLSSGPVHGTEGDVIPSLNEKGLPTPLISMGSGGESYAILVEKQTQRLFLYGFSDGEITQIKSFPCSTGKNSGDKRRRGDRRTPGAIHIFSV